jgi:hypothetical protein
MAYTGMQRASTLTIEKKVGDVTEYTHTYSLLSAFGIYTSITLSELGLLSVSDFQARLAAFKTYVESVELGLTVDTTNAYRENLTACPI